MRSKRTFPHTMRMEIETLDARCVTFNGYEGPRLAISRTLWRELGEPHVLNLTLEKS